jgi:cytochrome c
MPPRGGTFRERVKMKSLIVAVVATAGIAFAGAASAQADMAQKYCGSCHTVDKKKVGPPFKDTAAKYKGNASAEADLIAKVKNAKGHPAVKVSEADLTAIMKWVLAQ